MNPQKSVAFITWDGPEQNYMESLFLPFFNAAQEEALAFHVLQFSWGPDALFESIKSAANSYGIPYDHYDVWRKPLHPATAAMIARGAAKIVKYVRSNQIEILMPRSTIPAAMALLARRFLPDIKIFFDADGFMADERIDFGDWASTGIPYRVFREIEAQMVRTADGVMVRTHAAREILLHRAGAGVDPSKIFVIPNGKDSNQFSPMDDRARSQTRQQLGVPEKAPWVVYAGSLGPQYFPEYIFQLFGLIQKARQDTRLQILTGQEDVAKSLLAQTNIPSESVDIRRVHPDEIPAYLAAADLGLAFRQSSYSQRGVCPIKVSEYLLCGLPVVATSGVGDIETQLDSTVGFVLDDISEDTLIQVAEGFVNDILPNRELYREACRARGMEHFDLQKCAKQFQSAIL